MNTNSSCCSCGHRNPLHCILPPYMLDHLMDHKDAAVRRIARDNMVAAAEMRAVRSVLPSIRPMSMAALSSAGKYREVYDAQHHPTSVLPGKLVRSEGQPKTGDPAADEAYDYSGVTYDYYKKIHGRDSLDNHGLRLVSSVHVGVKFNNAFWNGAQMAYGDGDGTIFQRFTKSLDVVGHELTHGVVSNSADLIYQGESGALNEHYADVFGTMIKQQKARQTVLKADWLIGKDVITPAPTRKAIRSMAAPGTAYVNDPLLGSDPQPSHVKSMYRGSQDNGGVHINSGIPNHAFYLAATALNGKAWLTVGPVWYEVLTTRLVRTSQFADMARETIDVAGKSNAATKNAVKAAWKAVGL